MDLTEAVYQASRSFPREETYGLTSQLRRATASVAANIAEGNGRDHAGDYVRHLSIAPGSLLESETFVELALRLQYLPQTTHGELISLHQRVGRMLNKLIQAIKKRRNDQSGDEQSPKRRKKDDETNDR